MSDFQAQFDAHFAVASSAIANHTVELGDALVGLSPSSIRRLLTSISKLLGSVDRREAVHPEYLAGSPRNVPEKAVELISSVHSSFDSGVAHFIQNVLPSIVEVERHLMEAVGSVTFNTEKIKNNQVRAISRLLINAEEMHRRTLGAMESSESYAKQALGGWDKIKEVGTAAETDSQKVAEIRKVAERLSSGNANQNPLEKLVRSARERSEEIDKIKGNAAEEQEKAAESANTANESRAKADELLESLRDSNKKADEILRNATQAGLAGAYKIERDKLAKEQNRFAVAFYGIIIMIIIYAAFFLLPVFKQLAGLNGHGSISVEDSALMLLVRLAIISPVVWALIFTNRRFRYLETLQMDYAAKMTTALAYAGYIDEIGADPELGKRLKDGLVLRFLEHPSRLLGKKQEVDRSISGPEGVRVESTISSPSAKSEAAEEVQG